MKKLVAMVSTQGVSTQGKTPAEVAAELLANVRRYQESAPAEDRSPPDSTSDDAAELGASDAGP